MINRCRKKRRRLRRKTSHGESECEASGSGYHNKGISFHGCGSRDEEEERK
jgi:hypothetical protein